uniref:Uncharacterized protein n=1 Tax=Arundo donax TaxID=35708 RepID=A0A0A9GTJ9_ARUDO
MGPQLGWRWLARACRGGRRRHRAHTLGNGVGARRHAPCAAGQ